MRSASRIVGVSIMTVMKLLVEVGEACLRFHDETVRGLSPEEVEVDEAWSYCYAHEQNLPARGNPEYAGDIWTWVGIDPRTKLIISWMATPSRSHDDGIRFMKDLRSRTNGRFTISTDGFPLYPVSIEAAFGFEAVHRTLHGKQTGTSYTSHVERYNATTRTFVRRCSRMGYAFSKKVYNHQMALAIHFVWYNFCKPHGSLGPLTTPAMAAGLAEWPMEIGELLNLMYRIYLETG